MSAGNPIVKTRIPREELAALAKLIEEVNEHRAGEPFTICSFVLAAIRDKVAHIRRSRRKACRPEKGEAS